MWKVCNTTSSQQSFRAEYLDYFRLIILGVPTVTSLAGDIRARAILGHFFFSVKEKETKTQLTTMCQFQFF